MTEPQVSVVSQTEPISKQRISTMKIKGVEVASPVQPDAMYRIVSITQCLSILPLSTIVPISVFPDDYSILPLGFSSQM